ncbi:MAG TPA: hypothetical protein VK632_13025, partial [Verrucomicrobiae bacterium]|nr:hypothetical protein [Verrucomicrobiae bacterium]
FEMLKRFTAAAEALEQVVPDLKSQIAMMASQASAESTKSPDPENQIQFPGLLQSLDGRMMALDETLTLLLQTTAEISAMKLSISQMEKIASITYEKVANTDYGPHLATSLSEQTISINALRRELKQFVASTLKSKANPLPPLFRKFMIGMAVTLVVCLLWSVRSQIHLNQQLAKNELLNQQIALIDRAFNKLTPAKKAEFREWLSRSSSPD